MRHKKDQLMQGAYVNSLSLWITMYDSIDSERARFNVSLWLLGILGRRPLFFCDSPRSKQESAVENPEISDKCKFRLLHNVCLKERTANIIYRDPVQHFLYGIIENA